LFFSLSIYSIHYPYKEFVMNLIATHASNGASAATARKLVLGLCLFALLFGGSSVSAWAQQVIQGKVTDLDTKQGIGGVTVAVPSLKAGAVTDRNGEYRIRLTSAGTFKVEAKIIGYETVKKDVTVDAGQSATLDIAMRVKASLQNEVVVTGLTGDVDRNRVGNVITNVGSESIAKAASSTAIDAVAGRVTGAFVTKGSGMPGSGTYITLRGRKTISGDSQPLYVVDGVIIDNQSAGAYGNFGANAGNNSTVQEGNRAVDINPNDIEDMQVLKGASAAAMYGALAGNGVIIITTKRGKMNADKPVRVSYTGTYDNANILGRVPLQTKFGQPTRYQEPVPPAINGTPGSVRSWGAELPAGTPIVDHSSIYFQTGHSHEHNLTISGATPMIDFLVSGTYSNFNGVVLNSFVNRASVRANIGAQLLPGLSIKTNNNYINQYSQLPQDGSNRNGILLSGLRSPADFDPRRFLEGDGVTQRRYSGAFDNPFWSLANNKYNGELNRFIHNTELKWSTPIEGLTLRAAFGLDRYDYNTFTRMAPGGAAPNQTGYIEQNRTSNQNLNLDLTATYEFSLPDFLSAQIVLGAQQVTNDQRNTFATATNTLSFFDGIAAGATRDAGSFAQSKQVRGIFAQGTFTFFDRLSLTAAVRRDGSSAFGTFQQYYNFPKASISYQLSKESFMEGLKGTIDNVRLRASYGEAGSPNVPLPYATNFLYSSQAIPGYAWSGWSAAQPQPGRNGLIGLTNLATGGSDRLRPELSIEREIGIDLGFLNNSITVEASYYFTNVHDLILQLPAPFSSGYSSVYRNAGSMINGGWEFSLNAQVVNSADFSWNTGINYTRLWNLVTRLDVSGQSGVADSKVYNIGGFANNAAIEGRPLGVFYTSSSWQRDTQGNQVYQGDRVETNTDGTPRTDELGRFFRTTNTANSRLLGVNDDPYGNDWKGAPLLDQNNRVLGDPNPKFMLSWSNQFRLFNVITISTLVDGTFGHTVFNGTRAALVAYGIAKETDDRTEPWVNERGEKVLDETGAQLTRQDFYQNYKDGFTNYEPYMEDASFVRLRELSISYRLDAVRDLGLDNITFTLSGRNLATFTNYKGYDPEVSRTGNTEVRGEEWFNFAQTRTFRFTINLNY
jgi:TonB-linked SusC/RagA family outer membrane protein